MDKNNQNGDAGHLVFSDEDEIDDLTVSPTISRIQSTPSRLSSQPQVRIFFAVIVKFYLGRFPISFIFSDLTTFLGSCFTYPTEYCGEEGSAERTTATGKEKRW
jgi:hypothetical protein